MKLIYSDIADESRTLTALSEESPFPGDEVTLDHWGTMRVIRRRYIYTERSAGTPQELVGVLVWVRKEGALNGL